MNGENLMDAIGWLPEEMVGDVAEKRMKRKHRWAPWGAVAACLCLLLSLPLALGGMQASNKADMEAPMEMAPIADGNLSDRYFSGTTQNGSDEWKVSGEHFLAIVVEAHGHYLLVEPLEDEWEHSSAKRIEVPIPNPQDPQEFTPGDLLRIYYSGTLRESYPAQAVGVIGIERLG